ncbi:MAG: SH3 domain-containing protein [Verrucomicrobiota bacterium]
MINRFLLAVILSVALSGSAIQTNSPSPAIAAPSVATPPAVEPAPRATNATAEVTPAPVSPSKPKASVRKSRKPKAKAKAASEKAATESTGSKTSTRLAINPPETGTVRQRNVNVRGQASFVGEVITRLHKGESVTLLEEISLGKTKTDEPSIWFRIAMPTNTPVWVSGGFVDPTAKTVIPKKLKVRAGPGENFSMVGILEKGATVKEIRTVNGWIEIETPAETYAFVAADLIERGSPAPVPPPVAPEVVAVTPPPTETPAAPEVAPENPAPSPTPAPAEPTPAVVAPAVTPPPVVEEPLPKRIVTREGIVRRSLNLQTPSYYELESLQNRKIINYLYNPQPGGTLKPWIGITVTVTGEESIDKRWPNTPVIEIETIDQR